VAYSPRILVVVSHGYYSPWIDIALRGQNETWLDGEIPSNIDILHCHGSPLGKFGLLLDRAHERVRWSNRFGYALLRLFDSVVTFPFLATIPSTSTSKLLFLKHKTIHVNWPDSYLTFRWKAKGMFRYILDNYDFDFLFMTTSSSYIRLDELSRVLSEQNPIRFLGGASAYSGANFAAGSNRVLSRDLVQTLLRNPIDYLPFPIEDISMSKSLLKQGIDLVPLPHLDIDSLENLERLTDSELMKHYHFRLKSGSLENRNDVEIMKSLHERLKGISCDAG
jgi:hypothetical protein